MNKIFTVFTAVVFIAVAGSMSACKKTFDEPPGPADQPIVPNTSIASLKALHTVSGQMDGITSDIIISGIVTANDKSGNLYKEMYIEDSTGAIKLKLDASGLYSTYPVGRRIYVYCKDLWISDDAGIMMMGVRAVVSGSPSLQGILTSDISKHVKAGSIGNPVNPTLVTLSQLGTNMQDPYIGRLVKLEGWEFTDKDTSKTYSDTSVYKSDRNDTLQDCSSNKTIIRTSAYANFAAVQVPSGNGDFTAIYTVFRTTKQFVIRDTTDVQFYNPRCNALPPGTIILLNENFESQSVPATAPYNPVTISGWTNLGELGGKVYDARTFSANKYAYISAFGTNQNSVTTWLVTKGVDLNATTNESLSFRTNQGFILTTTPGGTPVQSTLKVLLSTDYTGTGNPWTNGTWTDVTSQAALSPGSTTSTFPSSFTNSGNIDLSSYSGTIYVAFKNEGADPSGTATDKTSAWEIDDVRILGL